MLYEAKQGSKAYEYIKGILEAEEKEYQAYMKRVDESVGFKFEKWQGYQPNRSLLREYYITAIWVPSERYETLDKKVWKKCDGKKLEDGYYVAVAPNKRYKQGKAIAAVLASYKGVTNHFKILKELSIGGFKVTLSPSLSFSAAKTAFLPSSMMASEQRNATPISRKSRLVNMRILLIVAKKDSVWKQKNM